MLHWSLRSDIFIHKPNKLRCCRISLEVYQVSFLVHFTCIPAKLRFCALIIRWLDKVIVRKEKDETRAFIVREGSKYYHIYACIIYRTHSIDWCMIKKKEFFFQAQQLPGGSWFIVICGNTFSIIEKFNWNAYAHIHTSSKRVQWKRRWGKSKFVTSEDTCCDNMFSFCLNAMKI